MFILTPGKLISPYDTVKNHKPYLLVSMVGKERRRKEHILCIQIKKCTMLKFAHAEFMLHRGFNLEMKTILYKKKDAEAM